MRHRWLAVLLVVLFGSFGAIYTWKYDKGFLITALILGALLGMVGLFEVAYILGILFQLTLLIVLLTRPTIKYTNYDKEG